MAGDSKAYDTSARNLYKELAIKSRVQVSCIEESCVPFSAQDFHIRASEIASFVCI